MLTHLLNRERGQSPMEKGRQKTRSAAARLPGRLTPEDAAQPRRPATARRPDWPGSGLSSAPHWRHRGNGPLHGADGPVTTGSNATSRLSRTRTLSPSQRLCGHAPGREARTVPRTPLQRGSRRPAAERVLHGGPAAADEGAAPAWVRARGSLRATLLARKVRGRVLTSGASAGLLVCAHTGLAGHSDKKQHSSVWSLELAGAGSVPLGAFSVWSKVEVGPNLRGTGGRGSWWMRHGVRPERGLPAP